MPSALSVRQLVARTVAVLLVIVGLSAPSWARAADTLVVSVAPTSAVQTSEASNFSITVTVTNPTSKTVTGATAILTARSNAMTTVSSLDAWFAGDGGETQPGWLLSTVELPDIPAGGSITSTTQVNLALARFGSTWGPRGIAADVLVTGTSQGHSRGVMLWTGGAAPTTPVNASTVVPILATAPANGLLSSTDLQTLTAADGALTKQLDALAGAPVTIAVDPLITTSIAALGSSAPASATAWLAKLIALTNESFELAYADADLAGQLQAGWSSVLVASTTDLAGGAPSPSTATPSPAVTEPANPLPLTSGWKPNLVRLAWPAARTLVAGNSASLQRSGFTSLLVSSDNIDSGSRRPVLTTVESVPALVSNAGLSAGYATALKPGGWQAGSAQVLAYLAAAATDGSTGQRIIGSLPRIPATAETAALQSKLVGQLSQPWISPSGLGAALGTSPGSAKLVDAPESAERVAGIRALEGRTGAIAQFATVTTKPFVVTNPAGRSFSTALSVNWLEQGNWLAAFERTNTQNSKVLGSVSVVTNSDINMVGTQANIPIAIRNSLTETATITVRAKSNTSRLVVDGETTVTIQPDAQGKALIPVIARVSTGSAVLEITLTSPAGVQIGDPVTIPINIRADWEIWGLVGFGLAFAGLVVAGIVRTLRRRRSRVGE